MDGVLLVAAAARTCTSGARSAKVARLTRLALIGGRREQIAYFLDLLSSFSAPTRLGHTHDTPRRIAIQTEAHPDDIGRLPADATSLCLVTARSVDWGHTRALPISVASLFHGRLIAALRGRNMGEIRKSQVRPSILSTSPLRSVSAVWHPLS